MINWKKIYEKLMFPPLWLLILLTVFSTAGLVLVFCLKLDTHPAAYAVYGISAYTVTVLVLFLIQILPGKYHSIRARVHTHPYGNKYLTDVGYKVKISLYLSLAINLVYSAFKLVTGILFSSLWLGTFAIYYMLLSALRFIPLRYMRRETAPAQALAAEFRQYRLCAVLLLVLTLTLTGIVAPMIVQGKASTYPGFLIFAVAAYTFYTVTTSFIDLVKYRKYERPVLSASKAIKFASALVSLISLEAAMLSQFGEDDDFRRLMLALTGGAICVIVLAMSVFMLIRSTRALKMLNQ